MWSDIRTATKLKLEAITGVENVLDYVVWTDNWQFILDNFVTDGRVNTWMVGLVNNPENELLDGLRESSYTLGIFAYYSVKTSQKSSKTFEDLVMTVRDDFMTSFHYVGAYVSGYTDDNSAVTEPPQNLAIENTVYLQQPCHRMRFEIPVLETVPGDTECSG